VGRARSLTSEKNDLNQRKERPPARMHRGHNIRAE
jgi:hypothetical protein